MYVPDSIIHPLSHAVDQQTGSAQARSFSFISPRTVEYHLHKVFTKLAIGPRNQLDRALPGETHEAQPV
jgi:hypothetical protein